MKRKGGGVLKGVPTTQSVYYMWFEYLRRSQRYREVCETQGRAKDKQLNALFDDFGDIHAIVESKAGFVSAKAFYDQWWVPKGQYLFGVPGQQQVDQFLSFADLLALRAEIESGDIKVMALPTNMPKAKLRQRVGKLITGLDVLADNTSELKPKYSISSERVDVESLQECLMAYDLHESGLSNREIYVQIKGLKPGEAEWVLGDARGDRGILEDWELPVEDDSDDGELDSATPQEKASEEKAIAWAEKKMKWREKQRVKAGGSDWGDKTRPLSEVEKNQLKEIYIGIKLGIAQPSRQSKERSNRKNYMNSSVSRMLKKAKANIEATERGEFCITY
ncbi:MAG: hypothetical protein NZ842_16780 [Dehalococcoidia bacterium]|nr:hypothetical protein [Dehalococcoidia bacterium]